MSSGDSEQNGLYIYWSACRECGYTTAVHGRARCPDCDETLAPYAIAGTVVDDEEISVDAESERSGGNDE